LPKAGKDPKISPRIPNAMNKFLLVPFLTALSSAPILAGAGPGPWANGTYYPGNLDGKYQAAVVGNNISGVLGFALRDGGLPFSSSAGQQGAGTNGVNTSLSVDPSMNYFAIFVEGRTYTGSTAAGVNYKSSKVTGALMGNQPDFTLQTNAAILTNTIVSVTNIPVDIPTFITNEVVTIIGSNPVISITNITNEVVTVIGSNPVISITNLPGNEVVTIIGSNPVISITNLPAVTTTSITNFFQTNTIVTDVGGLPVTNTIIETNFVTNIVTIDPITITNTNYTFVYQTNPITTTNTNYTLVYQTNPITTITNTNYTLIYQTNTSVTSALPTISNQIVNTTNTSVTASPFSFVTTPDLLPILNRGLSGGFQASIKSKTGVFTFKGDGELSTPAQTQTVNLTTNAQGNVTSGKIETHTVPFQVDGIRVSPLSSSGLSSQGAPN